MKTLAETQVAGPEKETQKEENKEEIKEESPELPVEKKDVTVELLKEGDCDLRELDQIFVSKPLGLATKSVHQDEALVIAEEFDGKLKDFDKLKLKLMFKSKSKISEVKNQLNEDRVEYKKNEANNIYERQSSICLKVHSNTGSQVSPTRCATSTIDYNNCKSYISNYPRPTIIYSEHQESKFMPIQFTVSSKFHREKSNMDSYPVGAGLIFCSNSIKEFENVKKYYQIQTQKQYDSWLKNRQTHKLPLVESEPAAFFELNDEQEVTVTINDPRVCQYVMLVPTDFRKRPIKFTKKFYSNNCEIESFKISGKEVKILEGSSQEYETEVKAEQATTGCKASIEFKKNGEWTQYKSIDNISIKSIESLTNSYCISLLNRTNSCVTGSFSTEVDLTGIDGELEGIRVKVTQEGDNSLWTYKDGHFITYKYPSVLKFKSIGLNRINEDSILKLYTDNTQLKEFIKKLLKVVFDENELEYIRDSILQHLNRLKSQELIDVLRENFNYKLILEDPKLMTYSDHFKSTIFKIVNKIGLIKPGDNEGSFFEYTNNLLSKIQDKGIDNFDITTMRLLYMINKQITQESFKKNYDLLTTLIFEKALPSLEKCQEYYPINLNSSQNNNINAGVLVKRSKTLYSLTSDFKTKHSIDCIKLMFDECTSNSAIYSMVISVFEVTSIGEENIIYKESFGDDVYQLCTSPNDDSESVPNDNRNSIFIDLSKIETESRYYRVKVDHIKMSSR